MKHPILALLTLTLAMGLCLCAAAEAGNTETPRPKTYSCGAFRYILREDGGAVMTALNRHYPLGDNILIPNELDGHPVVDMQGNIFAASALFGVPPFTVTVDPNHPSLATVNGVLFGKTDRKLICCPPSLGLTAYEIPQGTAKIDDYAFAYCFDLTSITIPESVTEIGLGAFGFTGLTSFVIPDGFTAIAKKAFHSCIDLTSVTIPDSVTVIGDAAFYGCTSLTSVTIPDSVTSIGVGTFHGCTGLTSVTIPDSVTVIGDAAFYGCIGLTSVIVPDSVTAIGVAAFYDCLKLTVIVSEGSYAETWCKEHSIRCTVIPRSTEDAPTDRPND